MVVPIMALTSMPVECQFYSITQTEEEKQRTGPLERLGDVAGEDVL